MFGQKSFVSKLIFGPEKSFGPKKIGSKKNLGSKKILGPIKIVGPKKILGPKKFWVQNNFGSNCLYRQSLSFVSISIYLSIFIQNSNTTMFMAFQYNCQPY